MQSGDKEFLSTLVYHCYMPDYPLGFVQPPQHCFVLYFHSVLLFAVSAFPVHNQLHFEWMVVLVAFHSPLEALAALSVKQAASNS